MKKILIMLIVAVLMALAVFLGWYFLARNPAVPIGESIRQSLPFGSGGNTQSLPPPAGDEQQTPGGGNLAPADEFGLPTNNLFRLVNTPVAGAAALIKTGQSIVRYVDRATGHIYDIDLGTLHKTEITNNTLPKIYEAYFKADGNAVLLRSLKDDSDIIENLVLAFTPQTETPVTASSTQLSGDIGAVAVGSGDVLIYARRDIFSIVSSAFNGKGRKTLLSSPFTDWRLSSAGNSLVAYTKASASAPGYAYTLNPVTGAFAKIIGPLNGLTAVSNTPGNRAAYSYVENNTTKLFAKNLTSNVSIELSPATLAEKCVWSIKQTNMLFCAAPSDTIGAGEPDLWYRGAASFSDRIWLFDTNTGVARMLAEPKQSLGIDLDIMEPKLSPNEGYLIFTNKADLSLWALRLETF